MAVVFDKQGRRRRQRAFYPPQAVCTPLQSVKMWIIRVGKDTYTGATFAKGEAHADI